MKSTEPQNGIWNQWLADTYHQSSPKLAAFLAKFLPKERNVIDFGCGNAFYISELEKQGFYCIGVEGSHLNNFLMNNVVIHDLTESIDLDVKGCVISLEVGEHLPESAEQTFLDTICSHCTDTLVLSWAMPNQPGIGHINCKPQEYIKEEVEKRGFIFDDYTTSQIRQNHIDYNTDWFRRTILIFQRP